MNKIKIKFSIRLFTAVLLILFIQSCHTENGLLRVKKFGNNPGNLKMFVYIPGKVTGSAPAPLVVVLHGCYQTASKVALQTGWNKLSDSLGFIVLYPQQKVANNPSRCFSWYRSADTDKDRGENLSVKNMIIHLKSKYTIDGKNVFITGLSAGAAMSVALMATYPELFRCGAIFAGAPYQSATSITSGMFTMLGWRGKSAEDWAEYVKKQNPSYTGTYPKMIIYQGENDRLVRPRNAENLVKQWAYLLHANTEKADTLIDFTGNKDITRFSYKDSSGQEAVALYSVASLGHALMIHPGGCPNEGGRLQSFTVDKNYHSTYWTAVDFGLTTALLIRGKKQVSIYEEGVEFSVPYHEGSIYEWSFPKGCVVTTGAGTNQITVDWGGKSGIVNVTETDRHSCKNSAVTFFVEVIHSIKR